MVACGNIVRDKGVSLNLLIILVHGVVKIKTKGEKKKKYDPIKVRDKAASFTLVPGVL